MSGLHDVLVVTSASVVWFAILTVPRWLITSIHRGRLWALRDHLYDEMRHGKFAGHEAQASALITSAEHAVLAVPFFTPWNIRRFSKLVNAMPAEQRRKQIEEIRLELEGSPLLKLYHERLHTVLSQQLLTGSWTGLVITFGALARALAVRFVRIGDKASQDISDDTVSVPMRHVNVEVKKGSALAEHVLHADEYLPFVPRDDHDDMAACV